MTSRRAPDGPNRLNKSAQKSTFNGTLNGSLRSARPTSRRSPNQIPSSASSAFGGGKIFMAQDGFTDVGPGDVFIDYGGQLWWKTTDDRWTHQFSGDNEQPYIYKPTAATPGNSDLFLGTQQGYTSAVTYPAHNRFIGFNNLVSPGSFYSSIIGSDNSIDAVLTQGAVIGNHNDVADGGSNLHIFGSYNEINSSDPSADILVYGSFHDLSGDIAYIQAHGIFNEIHSSADEATYLLMSGQSNQVWSDSTVQYIGLIGYNNELNASGDWSRYVYGYGSSLTFNNTEDTVAIGTNTTFDDGDTVAFVGLNSYVDSQYSVVLGGFHTLTSDYSIVMGTFATVSADFGMAIGYGNTIDNLYSWILGPYYDVATAATEEGILVAKRVSIHRSNDGGVTGGTSESSLGLDDTAGDQHILTVNTSGTLLVDGSPISGGATGYDHTQGSSSATWTVTHNLGYYPVVAVRDNSGNEVDASINHTSTNVTVITLLSAMTGTARFI